MREKIHKLLHGGELELTERLFRLSLVVGFVVAVIAIVVGLALQNALINALPLCGLLCVILAASVLTFRYHKTDFASMFFSVLMICVIFPIMFFASGGIMGGATVWFVLGILYIFLMFRGKRLLCFLFLAVLADAATYVFAYQNPEYIVTLSSKSEVYYDSLFAVLAVGIAVGIIMRFQIQLYEKERELTLRQKEEIEQISKSKDEFFTNMSHEIRTPINTIIGLNEMILREDISDEVAEDAVNVKNASKMLLTLINDILDFSQIESERMAIVPVQYHTKELFGEVVELIQPRMKEKKLDFYINIDSSLPVELYGDDVRIKQVLINILTNAVKYTPQGSVTLEVQGELLDNNTECLTISISDTGIGIKKEDLNSLYSYFKRIDRERNRKVEGSGLGLAITKQLVSLMGGKITVDSIYTQGSVFTVILNQQIVDPKPIGRMDYLEKLRSRGRGYYKQSFEAPLARILIVDDNEANLMVAEKLMRATKVQIDKADSGRDCLECTKKKIYHVILLDSLMPDMDGIQTLKEIRRQKNGLCRQTPIIALTANASAGDEQKYLDNGFDGYLAKPVEGSRMEEEILKFLPEELIEYQSNAEERNKAVAAAQVIMQRKRKKIQISTDCISDLSREYVIRNDIKVMYEYIETDRGCFRDTKEIDANNLSHHLSEAGSSIRTVSASVEEYEKFYAKALTEAEELIHISMTSDIGKSYENAVAAAECFDHVHVIDSGHISCGEGMLVLIASNMVNKGVKNAEKICRELGDAQKYIQSSFLLPNIQRFYESGFVSGTIAAIFRHFNLYPELCMKKNQLKIDTIRFGKLDNAKKHYIRKHLKNKNQIDERVVFITHAGCTVKQQREFVDEVLKYVPFDKVIIQKVSVSCASCAGLGTIGLAYLKKIKGKAYDENGTFSKNAG